MKDYICLYRNAGMVRLINTCKNEAGETCIATKGETILAVQERRSFLGIKYWRTIYTHTDYDTAVAFYKRLIVGHPDFHPEQ